MVFGASPSNYVFATFHNFLFLQKRKKHKKRTFFTFFDPLSPKCKNHGWSNDKIVHFLEAPKLVKKWPQKGQKSQKTPFFTQISHNKSRVIFDIMIQTSVFSIFSQKSKKLKKVVKKMTQKSQFRQNQPNLRLRAKIPKSSSRWGRKIVHNFRTFLPLSKNP